jgi:hypothetical protein
VEYTISQEKVAGSKDLWRSCLALQSDDLFLDICRLHLGKIKTPYNKQALIDRLDAYLGRQEIQQMIIQSLDSDDRMLISLILLMDNPNQDDLISCSFSKQTLEVQHLLYNLQERLLIFFYNSQVLIAPQLKEIFQQKVFHLSSLFPFIESSKTDAPRLWFNEAFIAVLMSFVSAHGELFKNDGDLKKSAEKELSDIFPSLEQSQWLAGLRALMMTGMAEEDEGRLVLVYSRIDQFCALSLKQRLHILWASASALRSPFENHCQFLAELIGFMPLHKAFEKHHMLGIMMVLKVKHELIESSEELFDALFALRLIHEVQEGYFSLHPTIKIQENLINPNENTLSVSPDFIISAEPHCNLDTLYPLCCSLKPIRFDQISQFKISKESIIRWYDKEDSLESFAESLKEVSSKEIPTNIQSSIKSWEKDFSSLRIYQGTVLTVSPDRVAFIVHIPEIAEAIIRKLGEGIFLMRKHGEWKAALQRISPLPEFHEPINSVQRKGDFPQSISYKSNLDWTSSFYSEPEKVPEDVKAEISRIKDSSTKEELHLRMINKLLLRKNQLLSLKVQGVKEEARGLDSAGKLVLVEAALKNGRDLIEIQELGPNNDFITSLIKPISLHKTGTDILLYGEVFPDGSPMQIYMRKIAFLRKIRGSFVKTLEY